MTIIHRRLAAIVFFAIAAPILWLSPTNTVTAKAATSPGNAALNWAEAHTTGAPFTWGGTGPGYDCSGLVMESILHATGISLPHYTVAMAQSGWLYRVPVPERGDLAFFGNAPYYTHVMFVTSWYHGVFGATDYGQRAGWYTYGWGWVPTAFYRIR